MVWLFLDEEMDEKNRNKVAMLDGSDFIPREVSKLFFYYFIESTK